MLAPLKNWARDSRFSAPAYARFRSWWKDRAHVEAAQRAWRELGRPDVILEFGYAPGDDLLCTIVARELQRRRPRRIVMLSQHPQLFAHNPDITTVQPYNDALVATLHRPEIPLFRLCYAEYSSATDAHTSPKIHIAAEMCRRAQLHGEIKLRPYLFLTPDEIQSGRRTTTPAIVMISSGLNARHPMLNKEWPSSRFQEVAAGLAPDFPLIQLGLPDDPALPGALDLRGRTTIREAAAILHQAALYIGPVGFLMHLARAVDCPSVIVYGGREKPWQSGYSGNLNLGSDMPCSPCWKWNTCDYQRACLDHISAASVLEAARARLAAPRALVEDTATI